MGLLNPRSTPPRTVADVESLLPAAWGDYLKAIADFVRTQTHHSPHGVRWSHVIHAHNRLNNLLDDHLELRRREQEQRLGEWWRLSFPQHALPVWPWPDDERRAG